MYRVEQFLGHLRARVSDEEVVLAHRLLPAGAHPLFDAMPVADRRHALDVVARLLDAGQDEPDLLAAALLHDAGKGHRMRLWHRVSGVLLHAVAPRMLTQLASSEPRSWRYPFYLYLQHAQLSADAAADAGCSARTVALIRGTAGGADASMAASLRNADEAS